MVEKDLGITGMSSKKNLRPTRNILKKENWKLLQDNASIHSTIYATFHSTIVSLAENQVIVTESSEY